MLDRFVAWVLGQLDDSSFPSIARGPVDQSLPPVEDWPDCCGFLGTSDPDLGACAVSGADV